ncbi:nonribosomal peptide synthetase 12 [Cyathus striatus]|nr:nonribosomal peptide synthetase 12 [Cyathus striatus]
MLFQVAPATMEPRRSSLASIGNLSPSDRALFDDFGSNPGGVAVQDFEYTITYGELDFQANSLATRLRDIGVRTDSRVCLLVERSILMIVGIVAVLKAGAAYVPLDGNIVSDSTLRHALKDSGSSVVLTLRKFSHRILNTPQVFCLDEISYDKSPSEHCNKPEDWSSPKDGAYVIYTSGTTGVPKGVDVSHGNVINLLCIAPGNLGLGPGVRVSQLMNISFDMAAWEILGSLCNGSTLCLRRKTSKEWRAVMKTVDVVVATPSMLLPHNPVDYPNIKVVAVAGEPCPKSLADNWGTYAKFYNSCGPTEITIVNTMQLHTPGLFLSIGKPTPNNNVYVLDENMQPLPIGTAGIMWAGGAGISRGYVNLSEKTAERYRTDPFMNDGSMMFNTGDLGRWLPDGTLEHLGRIDNQVKVKTCPGVQAATAILIEGELWGFVMPASTTVEEVQAAAAKIQPYYAVPSKILHLLDFPKTANGKTDRRALQQMALDSMKQVIRLGSEEPSLVSDQKPVVYYVKNPPSVVLPPLAYIPDSKDSSAGIMAGTIAALPEKQSSAPGIEEVGSEISSIQASSLEKEEYPWSGYEDDYLPEKKQGKIVRNLRHQIFTLYRRLFGVVFIINLAIFISVLVKGTDSKQLGLIVVSNLFCAILMRQDYVINAFFTVFCAVPTSWPLAIRRVCARVYHIGGLHSGCAVSGLVWLVLFTGQATKELVQGGKVSIPTVTITYCILLLLVGIVVLAYPAFRSKHHDGFERVHRFLGWTATALVWCQVVLLVNDFKLETQTLGQALIHAPPFWLVLIMTCKWSIILPWLRLRKVPVRSEVLSNHAVRLHFDYVTPIPGSFTRLSESPLMEWHGFATIPEPGKNGYSLVMWVRGIPTCGVLRIVPLFRRVIFVATGSGIGPCAPCILDQRVPIRLLWTSPNVRQTFGNKLVDSLLQASPDAVIYDTRVHGKPDMVKLTYRLVKEFDAEAVCVISNQKLTRKVVYGMMSRGIPAFGAIWDS